MATSTWMPSNTWVMQSAAKYIAGTFLGVIPRYILPVTAGVGVVCHLVMLVVIVKRRLFRTATLFVFLGFISALEIIFLGFHAIIDAVEVHIKSNIAADSYKNNLRSDIFCSIKLYGIYASGASINWIAITAIAYRIFGLWKPMDLLQRENPLVATNLCILIVISQFGVFITSFWYVNTVAGQIIMPDTIIFDCNTMSNILVWLDIGLFSFIPGFVVLAVAIGITAMFWKSKNMLSDGNSSRASPALKSARNSVVLLMLLAILIATCSLPVGICVLHDRVIIDLIRYSEPFDLVVTYPLRCLYDLCHAIYPVLALISSSYFRTKIFGREKIKKEQNGSSVSDLGHGHKNGALHK